MGSGSDHRSMVADAEHRMWNNNIGRRRPLRAVTCMPLFIILVVAVCVRASYARCAVGGGSAVRGLAVQAWSVSPPAAALHCAARLVQMRCGYARCGAAWPCSFNNRDVSFSPAVSYSHSGALA